MLKFPLGFKVSKDGFKDLNGGPRYFFCERGCDVRRGTLLEDSWSSELMRIVPTEDQKAASEDENDDRVKEKVWIS